MALTASWIKPQTCEAEWPVRFDLLTCCRPFVRCGWSDIIFTHLNAGLVDHDDQYLTNPYGLLSEGRSVAEALCNLYRLESLQRLLWTDKQALKLPRLLHTFPAHGAGEEAARGLAPPDHDPLPEPRSLYRDGDERGARTGSPGLCAK